MITEPAPGKRRIPVYPLNVRVQRDTFDAIREDCKRLGKSIDKVADKILGHFFTVKTEKEREEFLKTIPSKYDFLKKS